MKKRLKFGVSFVRTSASISSTAVSAYDASVSTAFFVGSVLSNPSNFTVMPDGRSNTGAPGAAAVAVGDAEVEAAADGEAVPEGWILSELSEPPPPQAVSSRPAETARATAAGRVERVTSESPVRRAE